MAGANKHMKRSHRSVSSQTGSVYNDFHRHANTKMANKQQKVTLGTLLKRLCPAARKDA